MGGFQRRGARQKRNLGGDLREDGKHVVAVDTRRTKPDLNLGWGQGSFGASQYLKPENLFVDGQDYVLTCMAKSGQTGSGYSGFGITFYLPDWKALPYDMQMNTLALVNGPTNGQWRHFVSKPFTYKTYGKEPLICSISVGMVYERGDMAFKRVGVYPANAALSLRMKGRELLQAAVEDDTGEMVFVSDKFTEDDVDFSATVKVSAAHSYKIKVLDRDGNLRIKPYPEGAN